MALTRKFLKAMGIEEEKIEQIIEAHTETTNAIKEERDGYKADAEKRAAVEKELNAAKEKIAKYGDGETVPKADFDKLETEFNNYKTAQTEKETRQAKEHAVRELYKAVGISEKRIDSVLKVTKLDEIELDKDGKIKDAEQRTEAAKTEWADFIETTTTRGANTANPPANGGRGTGKTKEEIMAIKDPVTRQDEIAKNPTLFGIN